MNEKRRTLLKGMLSGGTLLALGIPTAMSATKQIHPFNMQQCQLLLSDGFVGQAFLRGGELACTALLGDSANTLSAVKITNQLDADPIRIMEVFAQSSDTRWIAVMDYANAAIFNELVRASGARLLLLGSHSERLNDVENISVRHVLTNSGMLSSAGKLLAENLISHQDSFSIVENFLEQSLVSTTKESIAMENLSSFQSSEQSDVYLHCAGVTAEAGSKLVGWESVQNWCAMKPESKSTAGPKKHTALTTHPIFDHWVEATGYAIAATALGLNTQTLSCKQQAFVYQSAESKVRSTKWHQQHFVSFVIDV